MMAVNKMSLFDSIFKESTEQDVKFLTEKMLLVKEAIKAKERFIREELFYLDCYEKTGDAEFLRKALANESTVPPGLLRRSSTKENETPELQQQQDSPEEVKASKPKRNAFKEATKNINTTCNVPLNKKLRREDFEAPTNVVVQIKKEKISSLFSSPEAEEQIVVENGVQVKVEKEEMPAPKKLPPRRKKAVKSEAQEELPLKRSTRTRSKKVIEEENAPEKATKRSTRTKKKNSPVHRHKDSDVILETPPISTIDLSDSEEQSEKENNSPKRKRGRTKKPNDEGSPNAENLKKAKKSEEQFEPEKKNSDINHSGQTEYEDANSNIEIEPKSNPNCNSNETYVLPNDATFVSSSNNIVNSTFLAKSPVNKQLQELNETVVIEKPKAVKNKNNEIASKETNKNSNDLFTDDESKEENVAVSPQKIKPQSKNKPQAGKKPLFNAFEQSPVKKKVAAFEKLASTPDVKSGIPTRTTRTKTRALNKQKDDEQKTEANETNKAEQPPAKSIVKETAKLFTPTSSHFPTKMAASTSKVSKFLHSGNNMSGNNKNSSVLTNENSLTAKTLSALKASQVEYMEREKLRKEKECEATRKREQMLQAQMEDKKRRREEKQRKAQEQREAIDRELKKKIDAARHKEDKHKQILAEREEKLQKQKEEERKRLLAKKKAMEEKKREERARAEDLKKKEETVVPIYLSRRPPRLPTADCYDSDEEEYNPKTYKFPAWCNEYRLKEQLMAVMAIPNSIKNTFFHSKVDTPDLRELFEQIDPKKLKRTSSAVWHKAPRYTMMMSLNKFDEDDEH